jgi:uncharacterized caspase-like protein
MIPLSLHLRLFLLPLFLIFSGSTALLAQTNNLVPSRHGTVSVERLNPNRISSNRRIALIIGNANYQVGALRNPVNDARGMARVLRSLGFEVILLTDASKQGMEEALDRFYAKIRQGGVGVFYYAGHGIQSGGENYLIPVNANLQIERDLQYQAVPIGQVLARMEDAKNDVNIVILDACRDNPFARSWRSMQRGLAAPIVNTATGVYIAYATAPGQVAADGNGQNGIFTGALLRHIRKPYPEIEELFKQVREDVSRATNQRQVPWSASSLIGSFSFQSPQRSTSLPGNLPTNSLMPAEADDDPPSSVPCLGSVCEGLPDQK